MGFFSWLARLFGKEEKHSEVINPVQRKLEVSGIEGNQVKVKPKRYVNFNKTRNPEAKEYVSSIVRKANNPDVKPTPFKGDVDRNKVEKFVGKIQGKN